MKKLIFLLLWIVLPISIQAYGIVNNSGTSPEDSISLSVINTDSLGNPYSADSFIVVVLGPSGDSVFSETITVSSARIDSSLVSGQPIYCYRAAVADIDGGGQAGHYEIIVTAKSNSPALKWVNRTTFQLVSWELDDNLAIIPLLQDSLDALLDTLQLYDTRIDSILAAIDDKSAFKADVTNMSTFDPTTDSVLVDGSALATTTGAITATTIAADAIGASEIAADAIGASEIATDAITTAEIAAGAIANAEIANNAISSSKIATDAITADKIAASAIGASEIATDAITSSEIATTAVTEIQTGLALQTTVDSLYDSTVVISQILALQSTVDSLYDSLAILSALVAAQEPADIYTYFIAESNEDAFKATGFSTHSAADVYTEFTSGSNEDAFKATGFSTHSATDVWNVSFATAFTAGTMGDSLNNSTYVQGEASGLTAQEIVDSILAQTVADTVGSSLFSQLIRQMDLASDTTLWASLVDVWRNQDTANIDSSALGVWLYNNLSGSSGLTAQEIMDSIKVQIITLVADSILVDSSYYQGGTLTTDDTIYANIVEIDGDTVSAQSFKEMLDQDGVCNGKLELSALRIQGSTGYGILVDDSTGQGALFRGQLGSGIIAQGLGSGRSGLNVQGDGYGMSASGNTEDVDFTITPTDTNESGYEIANINDTLLYRGGGTGDSAYLYTSDVERIADVTKDSIALAASTWTEAEKDALLALLSIKNGKTAIRYVSDSGDGSDGLTWATAWTTFDSVNALVDSANMGLYEKTMVFIGAGDYDSVCCTIWTNNTYMIGSGRETKLSYWADYRVPPDTIPDSTEKSIFRVYSDYTYFMNMTLTSKDTVGDPEPGGGNCAIDFDARKDSSVHFGLVENCYFPSGHKHIQGSGDAHASGTSPTDIVIRNCVSVNPKLHFIDGVFAHSIIEDNTIIGSYGYWDGSASIQVLGGGTGGLMGGHSNIIRNNNFTNVAVGIALVYSDSNLISGNNFGTCNVPYTSSVGYQQNKFIGNTVEDYVANRDNIIENGSFEIVGKDKGYPVGWAGNHSAITGDNGYAGQSTVKVNRGRWSARIADSDTGAVAYLTTNVYYLRAGSYWWSGYWYPDTSGDDDMLVYLYKDKASGDSLHSSWTIRDADSTYDTWNATGGSFTVSSAGNYYLSFISSLGNDYYIDDINLQMVSLDTTTIKSVATNNPAVFYGPSASGSGIYTVNIYAVDTANTDTLTRANITIQNMTGSTVAGALGTNSLGYAQFSLDADSYLVVTEKTNYSFTLDTLIVAGNTTTSVSGYKYVITVSPPSSANLCRVYGIIYDGQNNAVPYASIKAEIDKIDNICDSVLTMRKTYTAQSNDTGYFYIDLLKTSCMSKSLPWRISIEYKIDGRKETIPEKQVTIPSDSTTYYLRIYNND